MEELTAQRDEVMRFLFDNHGVRGEIAGLDASLKDLLSHHSYPKRVEELLIELALTSTLIAATLKANGEVMIQLRGGTNAKLKYALININQDLSYYGSASLYEDAQVSDSDSLQDLAGKDGVLVISVFPEGGAQWQGIVPLEKPTLAMALEEYFEISEQLASRFFLFTDAGNRQAYGIMLQIISGVAGNRESLDHLSILTSTMTLEEFKSLPQLEIIKRLYAEEEVRIFDPKPLRFRCVCSRERCLNTLMSLNRQTLSEIAADPKGMDMGCAHCGRKYHFDQEELQKLLLKVSQ